MKQQYIYFEGKTEYVDVGKSVEKRPLGSLLFAFLDMDWAALEEEAKKLKHSFDDLPIDQADLMSSGEDKMYYQVAAYYQEKCSWFASKHPLFEPLITAQMEEQTEQIFSNAMSSSADFVFSIFQCYPNPPMTPGVLDELLVAFPLPDFPMIQVAVGFLHRAIALFRCMDEFQTDLKKMIEFSLGETGFYSQMTTKQRYYLMQVSSFEPYNHARGKELYRQVGVARRLFEGVGLGDETGYEITEQLLSKIREEDLDARLFYSSKDIRSFLLLELDYLCTKGCAARKCKNCERYFLPVSPAAQYCDRVVQGQEKTCKELFGGPAPNTKSLMEEVKSLFRLSNSVYQARCGQNPDTYPKEEYRTWKNQAKQRIKMVDAGRLTFEEFAEQIQIPERG